MKFSLFSKLMTMMAAVLLATAAYAASSVHKGTLTVSDPIQVNGKQLAPGQYTVTWDGEGPEASLHVLSGKKEVASAPCQVVSLDKKSSQDETEVTSNSSGGRDLTALRFSGQKYQLNIPQTGGQAEMKSGSSVK